jgi:hypothetical protein
MCVACANAIAKETMMGARFREKVEKYALCKTFSRVGHENYRFFKQAAKQLGMELNANYVSADKSAATEGLGSGYKGYDGYIKPKNEQIKIFGFDLMAVYFEPENLHFLALLNASEEEILRLVAKKAFRYDGKRMNPLYIEYNKDAAFSLKHGKWWQNGWWYHKGKHTTYGGFNSNRVIFDIFDPNLAISVEVESCEDTKSEWFIGICKQFDQKPLTWVGCAVTTEEREDYWQAIKRNDKLEEYRIKRLPIEEILSRKKKRNAEK